MLINQGHRSKALQCLPEQGLTAPGAKLDREDWSSASTFAWLEPGSTTQGDGARLYSACRSKAQRFLEQGLTGMIGAMLDDRLVGA